MGGPLSESASAKRSKPGSLIYRRAAPRQFACESEEFTKDTEASSSTTRPCARKFARSRAVSPELADRVEYYDQRSGGEP